MRTADAVFACGNAATRLTHVIGADAVIDFGRAANTVIGTVTAMVTGTAVGAVKAIVTRSVAGAVMVVGTIIDIATN